MHPPVPRDLRQNTGCSYGIAPRVSFHEGGLGNDQRGNPVPIHEGMVRNGSEALQGLVHGAVCCLQDVDGINGCCIDHRYPVFDFRCFPETLKEAFPLGPAQFFRVVQRLEWSGKSIADPCNGEYDGGSNHRAGERAASRFVHACESEVSGQDKIPLMQKEVFVSGMVAVSRGHGN